MSEQNKKILVVEDEKPIIKALNKKLTEAHFNVLMAGDGKEALEMALTEHPDLIILDILMPELSGIDMAKTLRKDKWGKNAPIIFLTNLFLPEEVADLNPLDYITKSNIDISALVNVIKKKLN